MKPQELRTLIERGCMDILGIDVGKRDLHACLLQADRNVSKSVPKRGAFMSTPLPREIVVRVEPERVLVGDRATVVRSQRGS